MNSSNFRFLAVLLVVGLVFSGCQQATSGTSSSSSASTSSQVQGTINGKDFTAGTAVATADTAKTRNLKPIARIVAFGGHAQDPLWFTTAPVQAAQTALARAGWKVGDVDLWEVNEAFAVVPMAFMKELGILHDKINVRGGAISLGHPIGASGARIVVTLLAALKERGLKRGVAAICIGGGEGLAVCVEVI